MVDHLSSCINLLMIEGILESSALAILGELRAGINNSWRQSNKQSWKYEMTNDICFVPVTCGNTGRDLEIFLRAKIGVTPEAAFPFDDWDICLEIDYLGDDADIVHEARWHFDLANNNSIPQAGPKTHLQFGGNSPRHDTKYSTLKAPRWHHHPMDLLLMLETVSANFYEQKWKDKIKNNPTWCNAINASQKLCIKPIIDEMHILMNASDTTILAEVWNR